eukprot:1321073-Amphidinium_carterae.1
MEAGCKSYPFLYTAVSTVSKLANPPLCWMKVGHACDVKLQGQATCHATTQGAIRTKRIRRTCG